LEIYKESFPWGKLFPVVLRDSWGLSGITGKKTPTYPDESGRTTSPRGGTFPTKFFPSPRKSEFGKLKGL